MGSNSIIKIGLLLAVLCCFIFLGTAAAGVSSPVGKTQTQLSEVDYKAACREVPIAELTKNIAKYKGQKVKFSGSILVMDFPQETKNGKTPYEIILSVKDNANTLPSGVLPLYVTYPGVTDSFIYDNVTVYGEVYGNYDYQSVTIKKKTLPRIDAKYLDKTPKTPQQSEAVSNNTIPLAQGITTTIKSVRSWKTFDGGIPMEASYEHWVAGSYSMNVASFVPTEGVEAVKAFGRFWELQVWFKNTGPNETTVAFIPDGGTEIDTSLLYGQQKTTKVKVFMIPGLGVASTSLVTSWKGGLGFKLKPGEETWILLVFDLPVEITTARLQIKKATPIEVKLP